MEGELGERPHYLLGYNERGASNGAAHVSNGTKGWGFYGVTRTLILNYTTRFASPGGAAKTHELLLLSF